MQAARQMFERNEPFEAEGLLKNIIKQVPDHGEAHWLLAQFYESRKDWPAARKHYAEASDLCSPVHAFPSMIKIAQWMVQENKLKEAEAEFRRATLIQASNPDVWNGLGQTLDAQFKTDQAEAAYRKALKAKADHAPALFNLASIGFKKGYPDATLLLERAVRLNSEVAKGAGQLVEKLSESGKLAAALAAGQILTQVAPKFAPYLAVHGIALQRAGDWTAGVQYLDQAAALSKHPLAQIMAGVARPLVAMNPQELAQSRERLGNLFKQFKSKPAGLTHVIRDLSNLVDRGAYDPDLPEHWRAELADLLVQCSPELAFIAPHCLRAPVTRKKKRIIVLARDGKAQNIEMLFSQLWPVLSKQTELSFFHLLGTNAHWRALPDEHEAALQVLSAMEADWILHLEPMADRRLYGLALARLSHHQAVLWPSALSFLPSIDYYLKPADMPVMAGLPDREQVVGYDGWPAPLSLKVSKVESDPNVLLIADSVEKIHHEIDGPLMGFLAKNPKIRLKLFAVPNLLAAEKIRQRWLAIDPARGEQIELVSLSHVDQIDHEIARAGLILEPPGGSSNTACLRALGADRMILTWPNAPQSSAHHLLTQWGMEELTPSDVKKWSEALKNLVTQPAKRAATVRKFRAKEPGLALQSRNHEGLLKLLLQ